MYPISPRRFPTRSSFQRCVAYISAGGQAVRSIILPRPSRLQETTILSIHSKKKLDASFDALGSGHSLSNQHASPFMLADRSIAAFLPPLIKETEPRAQTVIVTHVTLLLPHTIDRSVYMRPNRYGQDSFARSRSQSIGESHPLYT